MLVKSFLALLIYRVVFVLCFPLLFLALLLRSKKQPAYRQRIAERFSFHKKVFNQQIKKQGIVIHAASVGEVLALRPLVEQLLKEQPQLAITFTTFTPTGSEQVQKSFAGRVQHCYLPFDIWPVTWWFLYKLQPQMLIFMETELWPNIVAQAKEKNIKTMIINGRISSSSINQYKKINWLIAPCLQKFNAIISQSDDNQSNFISLGADEQHCQVSGNIKYDMSVSEEVIKKQQTLNNLLTSRLSVDQMSNQQIWVVASTHPGDEQIALGAFKQLSIRYTNLLLVLIPRHPERFDTVAKLSNDMEFNTVKRSDNIALNSNDNVWVLDSLGELMALYGLADIVTMGGSFSHIGGHNPLEPAWFAKPVIVGANMANFKDIMEQMLKNNAVVQLSYSDNPEEALVEQMDKLLLQPVEMKRLGQQAKQVVMNNQGATQRTLVNIVTLLSK
jgi:3-deoxy-D-manno-octulosonic-acid transferase